MAKAKRFRFETLLKLREQRSDVQKRAVAARLRQIRSLEHRRNGLMAQINQEVTSLRTAMIENIVDMSRVRQGRHWMTRLRIGVLEADSQIATQKAMLAQDRAGLADLMVQAKIMGRLKERFAERLHERREYVGRIEADDMNGIRFVHNRIDELDAET